MELHGIEVSEHQGKINWCQVKVDQTPFAMLCAGYGDGVIDVQFRRNAKWCNWLEIPIGVYWHSYAHTTEMAKKEAKHCIQTIEEFEIHHPVCFFFNQESARYVSTKGIVVDQHFQNTLEKAFSRQVQEMGYLSVPYKSVFHNFLRNF